MLYLIGIGLDKKDISLKALEAIAKCKKIYLEIYTTKLPYSIKELEKIIKKTIIKADRSMIENKSSEFIKKAKAQDIALLIYGDPLAATTHLSLLLETKKMRIKTKIIHSSSVLTAISETGLQLYKFGKTTSIPKWQQSYKPTSFYNIIKENQSINAHTLVLVDKGLSIREAINELTEASKNKLNNNLVIICSELGTQRQKIIKGKLKELKNLSKLREPFCIVIPASLHFTEAKFLKI